MVFERTDSKLFIDYSEYSSDNSCPINIRPVKILDFWLKPILIRSTKFRYSKEFIIRYMSVLNLLINKSDVSTLLIRSKCDLI